MICQQGVHLLKGVGSHLNTQYTGLQLLEGPACHCMVIEARFHGLGNGVHLKDKFLDLVHYVIKMSFYGVHGRG